MNTGPPRDISHAEQRSRSREDVPGGAAPLPLKLRPRPVGQPRPQPLQAGNGAAIAISSMYALVGQYERVAYCGAKAGMIGMVRSMALDIADGRTNVRVNAIAPGFIETDLARGVAAQEPDPEAAMRTRRAMHAIPRAGQPEEIGETAAYLASDAVSFITGQCLTLDGGYTVR
jgi:NAD(P)-dependent dehydrogenase (short-subunit alcohol dehydrogenase family)